ncbi:MAG TPA: hypothetical protein VGP47_06640 [Parachlamydiaceae bacterium]|nr:hypothetical protein [Parachlamydiaceae bacterium]
MSMQSFNPNDYQSKAYISPFKQDIQNIPVGSGTQEISDVQSKAVNTSITLSNIATSVVSEGAGTGDVKNESASDKPGKGTSKVANFWSNITTLFGKSIPDSIPHLSLGKLFSNVISSMNFGKYTNLNTDEVLARAINKPTSAAKLSLSVDQWVSLAQKDPQATGKLIYDQTHAVNDHGKVTKKALFELESPQTQVIAEALCKQLNPAQFSKVISEAFKHEIQDHGGDPTNLLRGQSIGTKLYNAFEAAHLRPFITNSEKLKSVLTSITEKPFVDFNKDNQKVLIDDKKEILKEIINEFIELSSEILLDPSEEMTAFREIVSNIKTDGNSRADWKEGSGTATANSFSFLRFMNPTLMNPKDRGVLDFTYSSKEQNNNGNFIGKIVQNLSSGTNPSDAALKIFYQDEIAPAQKEKVVALMNKISA